MRLNHVSVAVAIAGSAMYASAGGFSLTMVPSASTIDFSGGMATVTVTVFGNANFGTHMLGGAFSVASNPNTCIVDMSWTPASWSQFNTDGGYLGEGNYGEVIFGQLVIPPIFPPAPGSELGQAIGSFTLTIEPGSGLIDLSLVAGSPFTLEAVDVASGETQNDGGMISLGSVSISCIPTPGGVSSIALAGLLATRRRR